MVKKNLLFLLLAFITSCTNDVNYDFTNVFSVATSKVDSNKRSYSEALEIAQNAISILDDNNQLTRSSSNRRVDLNEKPITICADNRFSTRSSENIGNDTLMYVFNYTDNNGFAVVSADKGTEGLIAVVESGHYDPSDTTDTGFRSYMIAAKYYILANQVKTKIVPDRAPKGFYFEFDTISTTSISPRITVKWGQNGHEGQFFDNHISGCVNTAAAMIMSYFEYPTTISLTYENAPFSYRSLNWDGMKSYIASYIKINGWGYYHHHDTCTNEDHKSIGYLCRQLAKDTHSTLYDGSTSTNFYSMRNVMADYGYIVGDCLSYQNLANTNTLHALLSNGRIILMRGSNINDIGHAWVVDGYYGFTIHSLYYEYGFTNGMPDPPILMDEQFITHRYNHINWGYDGYNNGYFNDGVFSVYGDSYWYDDDNYVFLLPTHDEEQEKTFQNNLLFFSVYHNN